MTSLNILRSLALVALASALVGVPRVSAQVCDATTLSGAYGFVAAQSGGGAPGTGTPTGTPTGAYSGTPVGQLLAGLNGTGPFSATGRLIFDGTGNVASAPMPGSANTAIGTYSVNPDCSVSMSLSDPFGSNASTMTNLAGVISNRGGEVDLGIAAQAPTTGSTSTPPGIFQSGPGVTVHLDRLLYSSGCSASNLLGSYAFVATGVATQSASTTTPMAAGAAGEAARSALASTAVPLAAPGTTGLTVTGPLTILGAMRFDGAGNIAPNPAYSQLPLSSLQVAGTYTVNSDCTGSMTLSGTTPISASFVLVQSSSAGNSGSAPQAKPEIRLNIFSASAVVSGYGLPQ